MRIRTGQTAAQVYHSSKHSYAARCNGLSACCNTAAAGCSVDGLQDFARVVFQNTVCKQRYGLPRPRSEFLEIIKAVPQEEKRKKREWLMKTTQVPARSCCCHVGGATQDQDSLLLSTASLLHTAHPLLSFLYVRSFLHIVTRVCVDQGSHTHQSWLNMKDVLYPLYQGVKPDSPNFVCRVNSKVRVNHTVSAAAAAAAATSHVLHDACMLCDAVMTSLISSS